MGAEDTVIQSTQCKDTQHSHLCRREREREGEQGAVSREGKE